MKATLDFTLILCYTFTNEFSFWFIGSGGFKRSGLVVAIRFAVVKTLSFRNNKSKAKKTKNHSDENPLY